MEQATVAESELFSSERATWLEQKEAKQQHSLKATASLIKTEKSDGY